MATVEVPTIAVRKATVRPRRGFTRQIHLIIGLISSFILFAIAVSGAILAFREPIDRALNAKLTHVEPIGKRLPLDTIVDKIRQQYPHSQLLQVNLPGAADEELDLVLKDQEGRTLQLAVNPYTAAVLGDWDRDGNSLMDKVLRLHKGLLLVSGDTVSKIASFAMLIMSITGIVLWVRRPRWTPTVRYGAKVFIKDLHSSIGLWSCLFLFVFSLTAVFPRGLFVRFMRPHPSQRVSAPGPQHSPEELLAAAQAAAPGATPVSIRFPRTLKDNALVTMRYAYDHTPIGRTFVRLDPYTSSPLEVINTEKMSSMGRFSAIYDMEIHAGTIGGMPTRILAALSSLALIALSISGPVLWWQSRR